jgi:hypothetical protein
VRARWAKRPVNMLKLALAVVVVAATVAHADSLKTFPSATGSDMTFTQHGVWTDMPDARGGTLTFGPDGSLSTTVPTANGGSVTWGCRGRRAGRTGADPQAAGATETASSGLIAGIRAARPAR